MDDEDRRSPLVRLDEAPAILGVSECTIARKIRAQPPEQRPYSYGGQRKRYFWADRASLLVWWLAVCAPERGPAKPTRKAKPASASRGGKPEPVDWTAVGKELTGKSGEKKARSA